ncbi:DUF305 domain-containing protein [Virgisporangium aliadipatigenens]|uniref:DUF305 domain-containing protein n=2 Tax=Virgisporangium aliadipatigenens TaxID=741659 RepID=A0A8J4DTA7_9ACTN|nr:DUF305 domain-containing protein [Virgisporangium aliadipatigenens]
MKLRSLLTVALAAVLLAGCGDAPKTPAPNGTDAKEGTGIAIPAAATVHNGTDVMFLQMMITHHGQGLEMTKLAAQKATRPEIKQLAAAIDLTQSEEIKIMSAWLKGWNEGTAVSHDMSAHTDHGGLPATGPEEIAALGKASGADFDRTFLALMSGHQGAAAELTNLVSTGGQNPETKELARRIKESRQAQVAQMISLMNG